jgi:hypothetical protein
MTVPRACWLAVAVVYALVPPAAAAQETRADSIAAMQAAKAQQLKPYEPGKAERIAADVKRRMFESPNGFYPSFDSVYSGGGLTAGGGYRRFYGDRTHWDARGLYSAKNYKLFELVSNSIGLANGRFDLSAVGGWRDATQVSFYGVGGDTSPEAKSNFRMKQAYVGAVVRARASRGAVSNSAFNTKTYDRAWSVLAVNRGCLYGCRRPGLGASPAFLHMTVSGGLDSHGLGGYAEVRR